MKNFFKATLFMIPLFLLLIIPVNANASENQIDLIYFYSPTCETCQNLHKAIIECQKNYNIKLIKYDICILKNRNLLEKYNEAYRVPNENRGTVPAVFAGRQYQIGIESKTELLHLLNSCQGEKTPILAVSQESSVNDVKKFSGYNMAGIFFAGLLNGFNPCSLSMLLFFLSLLILKKDTIIKAGLLFCGGKFLGYLLLGTLLYKMLGKLNLLQSGSIIRYTAIFMILILVILNLKDFVSARNKNYGNIILKLPNRLRKINCNIIQNASKVKSLWLICVFSFSAGFFVSFGEFLCTGQIYLATIVTVIQTNASLNSIAFVDFILYDLAFIMPLLLIMAAVLRGREVFSLSEKVRKNLPVIKLMNAIIFILFGIVIFFYGTR